MPELKRPAQQQPFSQSGNQESRAERGNPDYLRFFKMASLMEDSISVSATDLVDASLKGSPINVRKLHKRAFLARDLSSSSSEEDLVPVLNKKHKGRRLVSSASSSSEENFSAPPSPHTRLSKRKFKGTGPQKRNSVFPSFEHQKHLPEEKGKSRWRLDSPSPSSSRAFAHSSSQSRPSSRYGSPEIDWESEEVVRSAASTERGKLSNVQMARVSLLGKTLPSKLFHSRWAMEHDSEVRDFAKLAFRSPLVKEDDLLLRNHIGIPDIQALMAPEVDPSLLSITGSSVSSDPTDQTFRNIQFKIADAGGPLLLMLDKAEKEGNAQKPSTSSLLASKMALLKASGRAVLIIGQSFNYISNIRRSRWLHAAGLSDLAPKSHEFPNLEDSYLFGPSFIQEVKGRYKARRSFSELKKSVPGYKKPFRTEGRPYRAAGASREASHQAQYRHYSGRHKLPGGGRGAHSRGGSASKRKPMHSSKCASSYATKLEGYFLRQMGSKDLSKGFTTPPVKVPSPEICTPQRGEPSARCLPFLSFKSRKNRVGRHVYYRMGQPIVPNPKVRRFLETGPKCEASERFHQKEKVQDGESIRSSRLSSESLFLHKSRPKRCLPFSPHSQETQAFSQVSVERKDRKQFWPETGRSVCIPNIRSNSQVRLPDLDKGSLENGCNVFPMDGCSSPLCFPPSIFTDESAGEDPQGQGAELSSRLPSMDLQTLVSLDPSVSQGNQDPIRHDSGLLSGNQRSSAQAPAADVDRSPGRLLTHPHLSDQVLDIINSSLRRRTRVRYRKMIEEFKEWEVSFLSNTQGSDTIPLALEFLTLKFHSGLSVSSIKTYGSALNFLIPNLTQDALYLRLLKGLAVCRPYTPRYTSTWDVDVLLNFLKSLDNAKIDLRWTAIKLASLLSLALAARGAELTQIHISEPWLSRTPGGFHIILKGRQKTSHFSPGPVELDLVQDSSEPGLCLVSLLQSYLQLSAGFRNDISQLFITSRNPFRPAKVNTIRGWILSAMSTAGIDVSVFKSHSIRGASATKAAGKGLPLATILKAARWLSSKTFVRFYWRPSEVERLQFLRTTTRCVLFYPLALLGGYASRRTNQSLQESMICKLSLS
ncbi:Tyrosine recombinase [Pelobates cultripes]|uniref:Tyrosine recombinase n=1 Tax=Pelobates cultripes TaxID=61616 RepID=A0AAD1VWC1_PELCU|nr:Tyrosine recombinase [Pelobates cultripes]